MLERAALLIGVRKTGGLAVLNAVHTGIEQMKAWALAQPGMRDVDDVPRIQVLSDHDGTPVTADDVRKAIRRFVDDGTIEQLFVYFAGHGANVRYGEYWLLSGAPDDANEAVNVEGSIPLARQCGIPHVVLISDACRTAAASIQSQSVQGSIVFPNTTPSAKPGCVDVFYATLVGKPALEVSDPDAPASFDAIYTTGLVTGLGGEANPESAQVGGKHVQRVRPWPLKRYLASAIPTLLAARNVGLSVTQTPDAIITSEPEAWLSQVDVGAAPGDAPKPVRGSRRGRGTATRGPARGARTASRGPDTAAPAGGPSESLADISQRTFHDALSGAPSPSPTRSAARTGRGRARRANPEAVLFAEMLEQTGTGPAPDHYETRCGFKVNGSGVREVLVSAGDVEMLSAVDGLVRLSNIRRPATNALIVLDDGRGTLIPAIPEFIAVLTYEEGELANVAYEISRNSDLWPSVQAQTPKLREIRRVVATAARLGVFRPEVIEDRVSFADNLREVKGLDPSMAAYAAYALHALQKQTEIEEMQSYLRGGLHLTLFDVAMLASRPGDGSAVTAADVFPAVPLLSQGWALLGAYGIELPGSLDRGKLHRHVKSSLWTLFDERGVDIVRSAITSTEIP